MHISLVSVHFPGWTVRLAGSKVMTITTLIFLPKRRRTFCHSRHLFAYLGLRRNIERHATLCARVSPAVSCVVTLFNVAQLRKCKLKLQSHVFIPVNGGLKHLVH